MSEEFIQFTIPCETCIVQSMCMQKEDMKHVKINRRSRVCLALPDWDDADKIHLKGLFECIINFSWKVTDALTRERVRDPEKTYQPRRIPHQYTDMLIDIIGTLQWIIHSTSWHEGELYNFDIFEIKRKLNHTTKWLTDGK